MVASNQFRMEHDFLGDREVPVDAYYCMQTLRGRDNFHITGMPISREPYFVKAFGYVKKAAAMANRDLGVLDAKIADAIIRVEFYDSEPVGIELPQTVDLVVKETVPGIKGATASAQVKPATLETGLVVQVPPFVNEGDKIRVNTETGEYQSRV